MRKVKIKRSAKPIETLTDDAFIGMPDMMRLMPMKWSRAYFLAQGRKHKFPAPVRFLHPCSKPWYRKDDLIEWMRDRYFLHSPKVFEAFLMALEPKKSKDQT